MSKIFFDTEFLENGKTIDLISIGAITEDGKEFYEISKEFNIRKAWYAWKPKTEMRDTGMRKVKAKEYWLRENVLYPIFNELKVRYFGDLRKMKELNVKYTDRFKNKFCLKSFKFLIKRYGKTRIQIAESFLQFSSNGYFDSINADYEDMLKCKYYKKPEFYAYYADYDWVALCQLYGRMFDLPKGFPMYCRDLKQMLDNVGNPDYRPHVKWENEHNALSDARFNLALFNWIKPL